MGLMSGRRNSHLGSRLTGVECVLDDVSHRLSGCLDRKQVGERLYLFIDLDLDSARLAQANGRFAEKGVDGYRLQLLSGRFACGTGHAVQDLAATIEFRADEGYIGQDRFRRVLFFQCATQLFGHHCDGTQWIRQLMACTSCQGGESLQLAIAHASSLGLLLPQLTGQDGNEIGNDTGAGCKGDVRLAFIGVRAPRMVRGDSPLVLPQSLTLETSAGELVQQQRCELLSERIRDEFQDRRVRSLRTRWGIATFCALVAVAFGTVFAWQLFHGVGPYLFPS